MKMTKIKKKKRPLRKNVLTRSTSKCQSITDSLKYDQLELPIARNSYSQITTKLKNLLVSIYPGNGGYGIVVMAIDKRNNELVAIKRIKNVTEHD